MEFLTLLLVVAAIAGAAAVLRRGSGRVQLAAEEFSPGELARLGVAGGGGPQLLLFTAPGCAPCTAARRVLDAAADRHGATVTSIDVTEHEQLARDKRIWRAPTVFVLSAGGDAAARISGIPRADNLDDLLATTPVVA